MAVPSSPSILNFWFVAVELAFWEFMSGATDTWGLESTASARASYLGQTSVIAVPILSIIAGQRVTRIVWFACVVSTIGLLLLSSSTTTNSSSTSTDDDRAMLIDAVGTNIGSSSMYLSAGDISVLVGSIIWAIYMLRTSAVACGFNEIKLQGAKTCFVATFYTIWFVVSSILSESEDKSSHKSALWEFGWHNKTFVTAWIWLIYSAIGPGAMADVLQQFSQKYVNASEAEILLTMEPIFTPILAYIILGEAIFANGWKETSGGILMILAALVVSVQQSASSETTAATANSSLPQLEQGGGEAQEEEEVQYVVAETR